MQNMVTKTTQIYLNQEYEVVINVVVKLRVSVKVKFPGKVGIGF